MRARLYKNGTHNKIWILENNGKSEALEYLLDEVDERIRRTFNRQIAQTCEHGRISNSEKFNHLREDVYEFKTRVYRLLCFEVSGGYVLTHGLKKSKHETPQSEIRKAIELAKRFKEEGEFCD